MTEITDSTESGKRHEGFMVDLLDAIADRLGFNYTIYEVRDKTFGSDLGDGTWDGMVRDLMQRGDGEDVSITHQMYEGWSNDECVQ